MSLLSLRSRPSFRDSMTHVTTAVQRRFWDGGGRSSPLYYSYLWAEFTILFSTFKISFIPLDLLSFWFILRAWTQKPYRTRNPNHETAKECPHWGVRAQRHSGWLGIEETRADSVCPVLTQAMAGAAENFKSVPASFSPVTNCNISRQIVYKWDEHLHWPDSGVGWYSNRSTHVSAESTWRARSHHIAILTYLLKALSSIGSMAKAPLHRALGIKLYYQTLIT